MCRGEVNVCVGRVFMVGGWDVGEVKVSGVWGGVLMWEEVMGG